MVILSYEDILVLIVIVMLFAMAMMIVVFQIVMRVFKASIPKLVIPESDPEELKTFINRT